MTLPQDPSLALCLCSLQPAFKDQALPNENANLDVSWRKNVWGQHAEKFTEFKIYAFVQPIISVQSFSLGSFEVHGVAVLLVSY